MKKLSIIALVLLIACGEDPTPPTVPTVTTDDITSVHHDSAHGTGTIDSDGGSPVSQHGFVWSTSPGPTVPSANSTQQGAPANSFAVFFADITPLTSKTKYYVRAYATNEVGTAYGSERTFTTDAKPAHVIVTAQSNFVTSYNSPAILFTVKNDGEKTAYNISVKVNALQGSTIMDNATAFPANLGDILAGQSAQDDAVFFNLTPAQAAALTYSTPVITWLERD